MAYNPVEASAAAAFKIFTKFSAISNSENKRFAQEKIETFVESKLDCQHPRYEAPSPLTYYFTMNLQYALMNSPVGGIDIYKGIRPLEKNSSIYTLYQNATDQYLHDIESFNHYASTRKGNSSILAVKLSLEKKKEKALSLFDNLKNDAADLEYYSLENAAYDVDRIKKPNGIKIYFFSSPEVS